MKMSISLKEQFTQKNVIQPFFLLTPTLMESRVRFVVPKTFSELYRKTLLQNSPEQLM